MLLRILFVVLVVALAVVFVEPVWDKQNHTLALRIRSAQELTGMARSQGVSVADRIANELRGTSPSPSPTWEAPPPVSAGPRPSRAVPRRAERISSDEQTALDSIIDQKTRE